MAKRNWKGNPYMKPGSATKCAAGIAVPAELDPAVVAELAYRRWMDKGCPAGTAEEDWLEAENDLRSGVAAMRAAG